MLLKILLCLALAVIAILLVAAFQPDDFRVSRSATLDASPLALFDQVNDHRKFNAWNPWLKLDPETVNTYSGPDAGVGATCAWVSKKTGEGSATIIESKPGRLVRQRMDWKKPMSGTSTVDFTFAPVGEKTTVTWAMYGRNNYPAKVVGLFLNTEKMCGPQFELGLAELGRAVQNPTKS
jgi:Polyketide cyclase / dehydrase and lipid transport